MDTRKNLRTGERRNVTVLFSDMKGFTSLSEKMDPEEIDILMSSLFAKFDSIAKKFEGSVEKYIGDALVAVFGAQRIHEDDPARAVNAALEFLEEIRGMNRAFRGRNIELVFRTGIHTGLIATGKRGDYDVVTGHTMSLASRLEESAAPSGVLVSAAVRETCESDFLFSEGVPIPIKGSADSIIAYTVLGRNIDPLKYATPFAGREQLVGRLLKAYLKSDAAESSGFFLVGEPGVGKTRLAAHVVEKARALPDYDAPVLYARARRYRSVQYSVINDLLFSYLHVDEYSGHQTIVTSVTRLRIDDEVAEKFANLISEDEETTTESSSFMLHYSILEKILERYRESPYGVILFVDNSQDLDVESRDFLRFFTKNVPVHPFIILAGRQEDRELLTVFPHLEPIHLKPLSRDEAHELLNALWPGGDEATKARILASTEGNPLFIEEYVKFAKESHDVTTPPISVQNMFLSAFERYTAEKQDLLKKLSVFVHSFTFLDAQYIQQKTGDEGETLQETLSYFVDEGILVRDNNLYLFKHDLYKQALYNSLLNYNKKILHRLVANLLLGQKSPNMLRLLHHLARAEDFEALERALFGDPSYLQRTEYLPFLDLLAEHVERRDTSTLFKVLFTKAAILFNNGKTEGAETILQEIMRLAVSQKKPEFSARAYHLLCAFNTKAFNFEKSDFCGTKAISYYRRLSPEPSAIQDVYGLMATSALLRGDFEQNQRIIEGMSSVESAERPDALKRFDVYASSTAERRFYLGDYHGAVQLITDRIPAAPALTDERWIMGTMLLVHIYRQMFDFARLRSRILEVIEVFSQDYATLTDLYSFLAESCLFAGERERVAGLFKQAEYYAAQNQIDFDLINSLKNLATALHIAGEHEKSELIARRGLEIGLRHSIYMPTFSLLVLLAEIYTGRGAHDDARYILEEADFCVERGTYLSNQDLCLYYRLKHAYSDGDLSKDFLRRALDHAAEEERRLRDNDLIRRMYSLRGFSALAPARPVDSSVPQNLS